MKAILFFFSANSLGLYILWVVANHRVDGCQRWLARGDMRCLGLLVMSRSSLLLGGVLSCSVMFSTCLSVSVMSRATYEPCNLYNAAHVQTLRGVECFEVLGCNDLFIKICVYTIFIIFG